MASFKSDFLRTLSERGFIHQISDETGLDDLFRTETVTAYIGFDATARSLHAGSLIQIMMLHWMQQTGHRPIALMGGGTSMIGDPSLRDEARKLLTPEGIEENLTGIRRNFAPYLSFGDGPKDALMINNADWLLGLNYVEFLRDVGRHFSVNRMLSFDSVKLRLDREQSLSFLEFNYMILQAYDFMVLNRDYGCRLQLGGSDQWGNIVNGIELARRVDGAELFGVTAPLITTADGKKMGKSVSGAVWLNEDMLPSFDFWQYWRNVDDRDVGRFLRLFTDVPLDEIARLEGLEGSEINAAKVVLANEVTKMVRGEAAAQGAAATASTTFAGGGLGEDLPVLEVPADGIRLGAACTAIGFAASGGEAKRKVAEGAVRIDDEARTDPGFLITLAPGEERKLSLGKKRHGILRGV